MNRISLLTVAAFGVLAAGCGTSYDLSAVDTRDELEDTLADSGIEVDYEPTFDPARDDGEVIDIRGLGDDADLAAVSTEAAADGLTAVYVDNSHFTLPDVLGLDDREARDQLEELLGGFAPTIRTDARFEPGLVPGDVAKVLAGGEPVEAGERTPTDIDEIELVTGRTKNLDGRYLLNADPEDLVARKAPTADGGTSSSWTDRSPVGWDGAYCAGRGGYGDIREGFNLTLRDAEGTVVSTASLSEGEGVYDGDPNPETSFDLDWDCLFEFTFEDVPPSEFYELTSSRGELTYSFQDIDSGRYAFELTLGDD